MEKKNVNKIFENECNEKSNFLYSGIRIRLDEDNLNNNIVVGNKKRIVILDDLSQEWKKDHKFTFQLGCIFYQCKVEFLPFCNKEKRNYGNIALENICSPIYYFEFNALNVNNSIYRSHWIMPDSLLWFLTEYPDATLSEMVEYAALENGYVERISETDRKMRQAVQLSIF